jgi:4'-phosphopantetheinyl transferase
MVSYIQDINEIKKDDYLQVIKTDSMLVYYTFLAEFNLKGSDKIITAYEADQAEKFFYIEDKLRCIIGRMITRQAISKFMGIRPCNVKLRIDRRGKPYCENGNIYFNISHSKDCVAVVFHKEPAGIDVEHINEKLEWKDIAESVFNKRECASLIETNEVEKFFMLWVYKEAIAKAYGCGLETEFTKSFYLKNVTYGFNNVYGNEDMLFGTVDLFKIGEEYVVAITSKREGGEWNERLK